MTRRKTWLARGRVVGLILLSIPLVSCSNTRLLRRYQQKHDNTQPRCEPRVDATVFVTKQPDKPSIDKVPKNIVSLSDRGQAKLVQELAKKLAKEEISYDALLRALAFDVVDVQKTSKKKRVEDRTKFKKRVVLSTEPVESLFSVTGEHSNQADRIDFLRCTFRDFTPKKAKVKSWDAITTKYETIDLGEVKLERTLGGELSLGASSTTPAPSGKLEAERKLTEDIKLKQRYIVLNAMVQGDEFVVVQQSVAGIDLTGNTLIDLEVSVPAMKAQPVMSINTRDHQGNALSAEKVKVERWNVTFPKAGDEVKALVDCDYVLREAFRDGRTVPEGDDHAIFVRGQTAPEEVVLVAEGETVRKLWFLRDNEGYRLQLTREVSPALLASGSRRTAPASGKPAGKALDSLACIFPKKEQVKGVLATNLKEPDTGTRVIQETEKNGGGLHMAAPQPESMQFATAEEATAFLDWLRETSDENNAHERVDIDGGVLIYQGCVFQRAQVEDLIVAYEEINRDRKAVEFSIQTKAKQGAVLAAIANVTICEVDKTNVAFQPSNCTTTDANGRAALKLPSNAEVAYTLTHEGHVPTLFAVETDEALPSLIEHVMFKEVPEPMARALSRPPFGAVGFWLSYAPHAEGPSAKGVVRPGEQDESRKRLLNLFDAMGRLKESEELPPSPKTQGETEEPKFVGGFYDVAPADVEVELDTTQECVRTGGWPTNLDKRIRIPVRSGFVSIGRMRCGESEMSEKSKKLKARYEDGSAARELLPDLLEIAQHDASKDSARVNPTDELPLTKELNRIQGDTSRQQEEMKRIVSDIDDVARYFRADREKWYAARSRETDGDKKYADRPYEEAREAEKKAALRKTLCEARSDRDPSLFDAAYKYVDTVVSHPASPRMLEKAIAVVKSMNLEDFGRNGQRRRMVDELQWTLILVDRGNVEQARGQLEAILRRTDGCAKGDKTPDSDDWIVNCTAQENITALLQ